MKLEDLKFCPVCGASITKQHRAIYEKWWITYIACSECALYKIGHGETREEADAEALDQWTAVAEEEMKKLDQSILGAI